MEAGKIMATLSNNPAWLQTDKKNSGIFHVMIDKSERGEY